MERLEATGRSPGELSPAAFEQKTNVTGEESRILRRRADAVFALRDGEDHPLKLAVTAYESFTSDGTAGNTETFSLSHSITQCPDTLDAIVWLDGTYYGAPDATDYANDTIDVTDAGTGSTVHAYYVSDASATLRFYRAWPGGNDRDPLATFQLGLVHQGNQSEDPETLDLGELERFIAEDMTLDITIDAPYTVQFSEDTDGTEALNGLLQIDTLEGNRTVDGLAEFLKARRGGR